MTVGMGVKVLWVAVVCVLGMCSLGNGASHSHSYAPSPSVDCSSVLLSMADCLTFVMNGSTISKPEGSCCSGFKTVLKENPRCLCEAFKNNNNLGIALNMTKATTLPSACGVKTAPISQCGMAAGPSLVPGASESPIGSPGESPLPSSNDGANVATTAPTPSLSIAASISSSLVFLPFTLVIAMASTFFMF